MKNLSEFTNLYSLLKTLRFELKPEPATKAKFETWLKTMNQDDDPNTENLLAKDKAIFDAYKALKPILDKMHEKFITTSLESESAKTIDFSDYFELYKEDKATRKSTYDTKEKARKSLSSHEKLLREKIGEIYFNGWAIFDQGMDKTNKKDPIKNLTKAIFEYIGNNIELFSEKDPDTLRKLDCQHLIGQKR